MNDKHVALFRRAEALVQTGQMIEAYGIFRHLRNFGLQDVNVLVGIAYTTTNAAEAGEAIATIRQLQPHHPQLPSLEAMHQRRLFAGGMAPMGPELHCPYCGNQAPTRFGSKTATGGWVVFVVLLIVFFPLCWLGFFIHEKYYVCSRCGSRIASAG